MLLLFYTLVTCLSIGGVSSKSFTGDTTESSSFSVDSDKSYGGEDPGNSAPFANLNHLQPSIRSLKQHNYLADAHSLEGRYHGQSLKRSPFKRRARQYASKRSSLERKQTPYYGVVYGNGRPVGILQPYPQVYEFSDMASQNDPLADLISNQPYVDVIYPLERSYRSVYEDEPDREALSNDDISGYNDDAYPSVLANFKIGTRMKLNTDKKQQQDSNIQILQDDSARKYSKRETAKNKKNVNDGITNEKVDELKSSLTELQSNSESTNIENVEEKIQGILEDMGLVDDSSSAMEPVKAKRNEDSSESSIEEDEDLDRGSNRIALTRDKHSTKTENAQSASENKEGDSSIKTRESTASTQKPESSNEKRSNIPDAHAEAVRVANYQAEGEEFIRTKREREKSSAEKASESEGLMKGLEKAGELTVSGNKSPLASSGNGVTNQKRKTDVISDEEKEMEEEARLERNIQAKIDAIKEEAKREISNLQTTTECGQGKRASNLLEQESEQVDPERSPENSALEPHVRKRRKRSTQERDANEEKQNNLSEENSKNINNQNSREREQELLDNKVKTDEKRQTANENFHASSENGYESENVANLAVAQYNQNDRLENEQDADEMPRRRRQTFDDYYGNERSKRAQSFDDYMPYRDEDEEIDDETDELDDDSFDDRTAALAETRMEDSGVYEPEAPFSDDAGYEEYSQHSKRSRSISPNYYAEWSQAQGPSITNYQYETDPRYVRRKRQNFEQLAALHGGSAVRSHLNAVRLRNMPVRDVKRQKRQRVMEERPQQLSDMSDTDLFGPLPQSYEGELARYKRVKRRTRPKPKLS